IITFIVMTISSAIIRVSIGLLSMGVTAFGLIAPAANAEVKLTTKSRLGTNGIGPVLTGMTLKEAERRSGLQFRINTPGPGSCRHVSLIGGPSKVSFMLNKGSIAVAYVANPQIKTLRGVGIGDSESKVRSLYAGQLKPGESLSARTKVLQFVPKDVEDQNDRIVFSFVNGKLRSFRSGRLPEVGWIEGCLG
ncbi:MAG: hypothetical protein LH631_10865, partial [Alkalinema sp. CAN_BIN05]|nr:hypothetical protein [Alkalinema sp. CAN_BIN05]